MRWSKAIGATVLAIGSLAVSAPGVAVACACGAVVSPDNSARVAGEEALVAKDGDSETVVMRLNLLSTADNAALVVPTPTPATVTAASSSIFEDLAAISAPDGALGNGTPPGAPAGQAPVVVDQVHLGPLEATTLTGGDVTGVQQWLTAHQYTMRPEVVARLDPYLKQGWSFVAMRLTAPVPLNGQLAPVKLAFTSPQWVYPMRLSSAAHLPQHVVIYTLSSHRMQRIDSDVNSQIVKVDFAGSIAGRVHDQVLTDLVSRNPFLTRISVQINDPAAITSDFVFAPATGEAGLGHWFGLGH